MSPCCPLAGPPASSLPLGLPLVLVVLIGLPSLPVPARQNSTRSWGVSSIPIVLLPASALLPGRSEGQGGVWPRPRPTSSSSADLGPEQGNSSCLSPEAAQSLGAAITVFSSSFCLTASSQRCTTITQAGPNPPAPAEMAKGVSSEGSRFGCPVLPREDRLLLKKPLLAGVCGHLPSSWLPAQGDRQPGCPCLSLGPHPAAPPPHHPCPPHQLSSKHPPWRLAVTVPSYCTPAWAPAVGRGWLSGPGSP